MAMADWDEAIARQSGKALEERERREVRYLLERFWARVHLGAFGRRIMWWVSGSLGTIIAGTQVWPYIKLLVATLGSR